jgi:isochorismate hydrolase
MILRNVANHSHNSITSQRTAVLIQNLGLSFLGNSHDISPSLAQIIENILNIQHTWELSRRNTKILMTYTFSSII